MVRDDPALAVADDQDVRPGGDVRSDECGTHIVHRGRVLTGHQAQIRSPVPGVPLAPVGRGDIGEQRPLGGRDLHDVRRLRATRRPDFLDPDPAGLQRPPAQRIVVGDEVPKILRGAGGAHVGLHPEHVTSWAVVQEHGVLAGGRFVHAHAGRPRRHGGGCAELGVGRDAIAGGPVLEDRAEVVGIALELRDPVGPHAEVGETGLEPVDPVVQAPTDPVGRCPGDVGEGVLERLLPPVRRPREIVPEIAARGVLHRGVGNRAGPSRRPDLGPVLLRDDVLLVGLTQDPLPGREQVLAQGRERCCGELAPECAEGVCVGSGPLRPVDRDVEQAAQILDLARGAAEALAVSARRVGVHPPEAGHRRPARLRADPREAPGRRPVGARGGSTGGVLRTGSER